LEKNRKISKNSRENVNKIKLPKIWDNFFERTIEVILNEFF
jgi:hypothetical protein